MTITLNIWGLLIALVVGALLGIITLLCAAYIADNGLHILAKTILILKKKGILPFSEQEKLLITVRFKKICSDYAIPYFITDKYAETDTDENPPKPIFDYMKYL